MTRKFDIIDYLSGLTNFVFDKAVLNRVALDCGVSEVTEYGQLTAMGVKLSSICPLMYTNNPLTKGTPIATNSNKLRTYSVARYYLDADMLRVIAGLEVK